MSETPSNEATIFNTARKIKSSEDQAAYLKEACGEDSGLQQRVEKLLSAYHEESQFLEQPAAELEATILPESSRDNLAESLEAGLAASFSEEEAVVLGSANHSVLKKLGQTINLPRVALRDSMEEGPGSVIRPNSPEMPESNSDSRYRLDGEIARGGMGAVIKGRDTDLGRDLAIKVLLDDHKDKPEVVQRFVEEAQIGGQLQHPGIAPVYELGQFADHRPFFSMKLVKGKTLSALLSEREDANADRGKLIGIFEQMCQTMAYAHSRGVIHRDLKPANIMVGAFGEVQVMDWGLAKVLPAGGVADEKKAQTKMNDASIIQTMRSVGSDTPGSFGTQGSETQMGSVMGTPAYMPPEQALGEIDHLDERADVFGLGAILCEILTGQPPYVGDNGNSIYRKAARGKLEDCMQRLDACEADEELVSLTKHCLELEPKDRPRNAGELAEQVSDYLESVENKLRATEREKADAQIRTEELRRRNKLAITAGTVIVAVLVIGISVSAWLAVRATNAETLAKNEATRATTAEGEAKVEAARALEAEKVAKAEATRATAAEKKTAETLVQVAAERDAKELARKEAEQISKFLSEVFQSPDPARDGRTITVAETLDTAAKKLETDLADQPAQRAKLQYTLGCTYSALGLYQQSISLLEKEREYCLVTYGLEHFMTIDTMNRLGYTYRLAGSLDESMEISEEVLKLTRKLYAPEEDPNLVAMSNLANTYSLLGRQDEALELREETLSILRKLVGPEHPNMLKAMHNLALSYHSAGRHDEAFEMSEEALKLDLKISGPEHPNTILVMRNLASSYHTAGRLDEALEMCEEVVKLSLKVLGPEHPETLFAMHDLAVSYECAGRKDEELEMREEVLKVRRKVLGPEHDDTLDAMHNLANSYDSAGRREEEIKLREEALKTNLNIDPKSAKTAGCYSGLGFLYDQMGRGEDAIEFWQKAVKINPELANEHFWIGAALCQRNRHEEALPFLKRGLELYPTGERNKEIIQRYLTVLTALDRSSEIMPWLMEQAEHQPENAFIHFQLGIHYEEQENDEKAVIAYQRAIEIDPDYEAAYTELIGILIKKEDLTTSIDDLKRMHELQPTTGTALLLAKLISYQWSLEKWSKQFVMLDEQNESSGITLNDVRGDGITEPAMIEGQECRLVQKKNKVGHAYFTVDEEFKTDTSMHAVIQVEYWDNGKSVFYVQYDTEENSYFNTPERVTIGETKQWKTAEFTVKNAQFANSQNGKSDFRIAKNGEGLHIRKVSLQRVLPKTDTTNAWTKLAAAYELIGDQQAHDKLLEEHPELKTSLGDLQWTP